MDIIKHKKNVKYLLLFSIIILIGIWYFVPKPMKNESEIAKLLGISSVSLCSTNYYMEDFTIKDCDLIEIYDLTENTIASFVSQSTFILYDEYYESRLNFKKINWRKSPIDSIAFKEVIDFALMDRRNYLQNSTIERIHNILNSKGAYYSFYYKIGNVAFYVLDIKSCRLYIIYFYF